MDDRESETKSGGHENALREVTIKTSSSAIATSTGAPATATPAARVSGVALKTKLKVSSASFRLSPAVWMVKAARRWLPLKVSVPPGGAPPLKSAAEALPAVYAQLTVSSPSIAGPVRLTAKTAASPSAMRPGGPSKRN